MADFYKQNIPILDSDGHFQQFAPPPKQAMGLIPRDYATDPQTMFASPDQMVTIPKSEWDARYDEQERLQSSLEHKYLSGPNGDPAFVNLDQNGQGFCHSADTEVLTEKGFVKWPEYNWSDPLATVNPVTYAMEYQLPFEKHVYEYEGQMVHSTNRRVDFGVTPDHQMWVRKWDESKRTLANRYSFVKAKDLGWYTGLMHAPAGWLGTDLVELEIPGDRRYDGDDLLMLLGLVVSDGYAGGTEKTKNWVSFASFREEYRDAVTALAQRIGFHESPSRRGVWIRYNAGALAKWIRQHCYTSPELKSQNKRVPELIKSASMRQIYIFLNWFDDRDKKGRQFYSTSKKLMDDLQELHMKIGKRSVIDIDIGEGAMLNGKRIKPSNGYVLTVGEADRLCLDKKKHLVTDTYKGLVYCAAVPNHTLITRRNGTTLISSNCWAYSTGHAIMLKRLAQNQTMFRVNPHATANIIKGGRDEGGWCGLSCKWGMEHGYAEEGTGPGQWPKQAMGLKYDTPELRAAMAKHKIEDQWYDLKKQDWDHEMTSLQLATCGFNNTPAPSDFNWWGHSVCQVRWVRIEAGSWGPLILNSWLNWGRHGLAVLRGSQAIADNAVAILSTTAS